ncbi:rapamycin-insensitive companion of mTOR isoform X2 [Manduca sexta]|uniref:rapamycin-insensitive companion of mTOR isoform X2 n=1 Tax=Manduca sexta TaxID=7130 RepID=UPI00188E66B5|nr:rapamycin-insensitive companion of mTOR isoform X2 [Manduca sexta]
MATSENWLSRRKGKHGGDLFKLDTVNKTPEENIKEIIHGLYQRKPFQIEISPNSKNASSEYRHGLRGMQRSSSDSRRLSYLNALVTLLCKEDRSTLGFTPDELMTCIRISLVDDSMVIRAAALRVLRYLIKTENDVATFNNLKLPYLVIRSMELMVRNEEERAQALRVARRAIGAAGATATSGAMALLRCLAALAPDPAADRLSRPAAATLAEICVLNPELFAACGGVSAVSRQLAECATPRMAEALCGVLLHALNDPATRRAARLDLMHLSSPYCDFHFKPAGTETSRDEREMRFTCSRLALLCVLRSWPGVLHFCHPRSSGGLRALVAALYLPRLEVRKAILDLLYELVGLPQPEWTDEISVALDAVDPSDFQDAWRLNEGFVAAEGIAILPHLGATGPDITEIHLALLLQCFIEAGLLDGLAEVIVTSDTFISVRATVLLGQLLHLIHQLVPARLHGACPAPAALGRRAAAGGSAALAAAAALRRLRDMLRARPAAATLFLDHVVQWCAAAYRRPAAAPAAAPAAPAPAPLDESDEEREPRQRHSVGSRADVSDRNVCALVKSKSVTSRTGAAVGKVAKSAKFFNLFERDGDGLIRSTLVMQNKDGNTWNWEIIRTILKETDSTPFLNLNDSGHKTWAARIINYLKPSSNKYSHTDLSSTCNGHSATRAGCQLIRHLLKHNDADSQKMLEDLFFDVSRQIEAIETGVKAHECLFSPQHMSNTMCQMYFLFIGQLCHSSSGLDLFKRTRLYENLLELSTKTHHSCYVKLIISSLDYSMDSYPRDILAKTLTCNIQASRLYATQFLNVLLRASRKSREMVRRKAKLKKTSVPDPTKPPQKDDSDTESGTDMDTWILQILVGQVKDESKAVVKVALSILEEAFSIPAYVEKLMPMRDTLCQNCRLDKHADPATLDFSAVGDRGYLLWLTLEVAASQVADVKSVAFIKKHLDFWTKSYNYRYARLVESGAHAALAVSEASEGAAGRGAVRTRRCARPPPHLHAALAARAARHARPRALHALLPVLPEHHKILQRKKCSTEQEIADVKASLWAVGNTAVTSAGLQLLMSLSNGYIEDSVLVHIVRLVKYCPVYSVRATAFYVLSLIGSTYDGANMLADLGWLCVRHTRHDQFPVLPEENCTVADTSADDTVTSPDCRYNAYDTELSEHSDHTDLSVAESLHSDYKLIGKVGSVLEQSDQDVVDNKLNVNESRRDQDKRKSHTLPSQGFSGPHDRPMLSESKTVDILRDCSNYDRSGPHRMPISEHRQMIGRMNSLDHTHEGRVRNTSESSTSGVSSCDSFLGKYVLPDRVLTLSPIPSSSSLYGMKGGNSSQRSKIPELQRRFSGHDSINSPPTQMDMNGYAMIKSLNRRPHLSESAATGCSEIDDLSWLLSDKTRRTNPFSSLRDRSRASKERLTKQSLLEYDWKPLPLSESGRVSPPLSAACAAGAAGGACAGGAGGACAGGARGASVTCAGSAPARAAHAHSYIGICLPTDLMDIFPTEEERRDDDTDRSDHFKRGRVSSFLADINVASTDIKSRSTPEPPKLNWKGAEVITAAVNLRCTASAMSSAILNTSDIKLSKGDTTENAKTNVMTTSASSANKETLDDKISSLSEMEEDNDPATLTSIKNITEGMSCGQDITSAKDISESDVAIGKYKWLHSASNCLACARTRPPSSYELREAFFAGMDASTSASQDKQSPSMSPTTSDRGVGSPHAELLRQVHLMANPIHLRQTRSVLLSLKQRHPEVFRSPCVYSDVCSLLARDTYMLCARRFLQELFLDTCFDCFAAEPAAILARHGALASPVGAGPIDVRQ